MQGLKLEKKGNFREVVKFKFGFAFELEQMDETLDSSSLLQGL